MPDPDPSNLTIADPDDLAFSIAHALLFNGRKRTDQASQLMARVTAHHLMERLRLSGYVVMKKPPAKMHGTDASYRGSNKHLTE